MSKRRNETLLTDEDRALFRAAMAGAAPAPEKRRAPAAAPLTPRPARDERRPAVRAPKASEGEARIKAPSADPRAFRKLARGKLRPESTLDLHGHTLARGHEALNRFIARAQAEGLRRVLVVTGKGATDAPSLRSEAPRWLDQPGLRRLILGYSPAGPQDGGTGALYVLLKRAR